LELVRNPVGRSALLLIGLGCITGGLVFVSLASDRLGILQRWAPTRHLAASATVAAGILRSPSTLVSVFGLSFGIQFLTAFNAWCAAHAVGADLPLLYAVFLVLPVMLVAVVPISIAGWGIREGAMVAAFGYAGLPPGDGLIVSLLYGATFLTAGIVGGLVWLATGRQKFQGEIAPADGSG
ncbi:MAG: lysylphosphatidylglycerol synthase transmembrane domain-containing protein, partial [Pseudolabrys sp.]